MTDPLDRIYIRTSTCKQGARWRCSGGRFSTPNGTSRRRSWAFLLWTRCTHTAHHLPTIRPGWRSTCTSSRWQLRWWPSRFPWRTHLIKGEITVRVGLTQVSSYFLIHPPYPVDWYQPVIQRCVSNILRGSPHTLEFSIASYFLESDKNLSRLV